MGTDETERIKTMEMAISNEMRERKFYLKQAARSKNPLAKTMFQQIADDELEHYKRLKEMEERWKEAFPETIVPEIHGMDLQGTLKDLLATLDTLPETDQDELQAIRTAIDFEKKGADRYIRLRNFVTDEKEKAFFGLLAEMELEHLRMLKQTESFLTNPENWTWQR